MPIFHHGSDSWKAIREITSNYHRTDYFSELVRETTGRGANTGAAGDYLSSASHYLASSTQQQLNKLARGVNVNSNRLQGVTVATTPPTNGQVLVYDATKNAYVPTTLPISESSNCILAGNQSFVNGSQPVYTLGVGGVLDIALVGAAGGVEGVIGSNNAAIEVSYAGTAKNMFANVVVNGPAGTSYTLTLFSTATGNTSITKTLAAAGAGFTLLSFSDITHSYTAFQFEGLFYKLTHTAAVSVDIRLQGYSLEYDHA